MYTASYVLDYASSYISLLKMLGSLKSKHVLMNKLCFSLHVKGSAHSELKLILSGSVKAMLGAVRRPRVIICPKGKIQEWRGHNDKGLK